MYQESDEPLDDWEDSEPDDDEDSDATSTITCPECGEEVYEDSEQCPHCGQYITFPTSALSGRPGWFVVLGLVGIVAAMIVLLALYR